MIFWIDAQLSPRIAYWLSESFGIRATPVRDLGLREASDQEIFMAARTADVVVVTKDLDFVEMVERLGPPPQVLWLTCGNTSDQQLRRIFDRRFREVKEMLESGEPLVEVR